MVCQTQQIKTKKLSLYSKETIHSIVLEPDTKRSKVQKNFEKP